MHPKREVLLISPVENDPAFDDLPINKIEPNEELLDNPIDLNELENSLVIFDDTDSIVDPKVKKMIQDLISRVLEVGRHKNISAIICIHKICNFRETRTLLNEAHYVVLFLRGNRSHMTKYYLKQHQDISRKGMKKLYSIPSRYIVFSNTFPSPILHERGCYIPEMDDCE